MSGDRSTPLPGSEKHTKGSSRTIHQLRPNSVGIFGVLFMSVATAAPITAMVGNVPIAIGSGNGAGAPAGYLVATIVLGLFALGYSAMAKHVTTTGAFYGYISRDLGPLPGLISGLLTTFAYIIFEAGLVGIFGYFGTNLFKSFFGIHISWMVFAAVMLVVNAILTYFNINIASKILGFFLVTEILILGIMAMSVVVTGGGPEGWSWESLNPISAFQSLSGNYKVPSSGSTIAVSGTAGIGLFFAFWSWVGFESSAMYGEESKNPKKVVPLAIMASVLGVGVFYVLISWLVVVGTGPVNAIALAQDPSTTQQIFLGPLKHNVGDWAVIIFRILLMTGSYACGMAFHNCAARYLYALSREGFIRGAARTLGRTHRKHGSPYIAGATQSVIAAVIVVAFLVTGNDPYDDLYTLMALMGTAAIMIVQALTAFSSIAYFHVRRNHPETRNWFRTLVAPLIGGVGMAYVIYLLIRNANFAAGTAAGNPVFKAIPFILAVIVVGGFVLGLYLRFRNREAYRMLGQLGLEDFESEEEETSRGEGVSSDVTGYS